MGREGECMEDSVVPPFRTPNTAVPEGMMKPSEGTALQGCLSSLNDMARIVDTAATAGGGLEQNRKIEIHYHPFYLPEHQVILMLQMKMWEWLQPQQNTPQYQRQFQINHLFKWIFFTYFHHGQTGRNIKPSTVGRIDVMLSYTEEPLYQLGNEFLRGGLISEVGHNEMFLVERV